MGSRTLWLWVFVGCLGVTALLGMLALLLPEVPFEGELLGSSALLTGYSLLGLAASIAIARRQMPRLAWLAVGLLAVSLFTWLFFIWFESRMHWSTEEAVAKFGAFPTTAGLLALHAVLLSFAPVRRSFGRLTRTCTIVGAVAGGTLLLALVWELAWIWGEEWTARLMGAFLIPAALGTIAVPVLARIEQVNRTEEDAETLGASVMVEIRCPRCGNAECHRANRGSRCGECGLEIRLSVSEPRCVCGYLLQGLPRATCPECGRELDEKRWWGGAEPSA